MLNAGKNKNRKKEKKKIKVCSENLLSSPSSFVVVHSYSFRRYSSFMV
jgi:hypothetical protein